MQEAIDERNVENAFGADFHGFVVVLVDDDRSIRSSQSFGTRGSIRVAFTDV